MARTMTCWVESRTQMARARRVPLLGVEGEGDGTVSASEGAAMGRKGDFSCQKRAFLYLLRRAPS